EKWNERIEMDVKSSGLVGYPQEFEICSYEEMLGYEAYIGMPCHYPHWSYGKAFERLNTFYRFNLSGLPYEMVINSNPCLAYLMRDNSLLLQILTIAHVYGHNDFFKNNRLFRTTRADLTIENFKNHADRIRAYLQDPSIGYLKVERVLDAAHALRFQINRIPGRRRLTVEEQKQRLVREYQQKMQRDAFGRIPELSPPDLNKIPLEAEEDLLLFIAEYGQMEEWERDILRIVHDESEYFLPQIETKIMNEGWASFWHFRTLQNLKLSSDLHLEFLKRHHQVIRPHEQGLNPYHFGFTIFHDLEKRFGLAKIFEAREIENDRSFIRRYLTRELCEELHLFEYYASEDKAIVSEVADEEGWEHIRDTLCASVGTGSIPVIKVKELTFKDRSLLLEHEYDQRDLEMTYAGETLKYLAELWGHPVELLTRMSGKEKRLVCGENKKITVYD
ncbi:MAG TPA: stage V sporulation protein R, partial [Firmicutes bacterium]|nr:stage V sporulation protein R [Bacillota bacterium]